VIVGSSAHNQRVEQFNKDLNVNIAQVFSPQLQELEDIGLLDINNETNMFCLHTL
jgi:Uri superfamily endonuclease